VECPLKFEIKFRRNEMLVHDVHPNLILNAPGHTIHNVWNDPADNLWRCTEGCGAAWVKLSNVHADDAPCNSAWRRAEWDLFLGREIEADASATVWEGIADEPAPTFQIGRVGTIVNGVVTEWAYVR
jgi:hypothetical protein